MILDDNIIAGVEKYRITSLVSSLDDASKQSLLYNNEFFAKHEFQDYEIKDIILSLGEEAKKDL